MFLALKSDNFHDFFTEYIPYGEEAVLYFEERDFYRRFPNSTRNPNRSSGAPKDEGQSITIPSKSGLSWKVADDGDSGSDVSQKAGKLGTLSAESNESPENPVLRVADLISFRIIELSVTSVSS